MEPHAAGQSELRHERSNIQFRPVLLFAVGLVMLSVMTFAAMGWLFNYFAVRQATVDVPPSPLADPRQLPPEPRLQVSPGVDLKRTRAAENATLHSYRWVDRDAGVVGIPIDRAIAILAEKGLPVRGEAKAE
jgi:hypothetical protein